MPLNVNVETSRMLRKDLSGAVNETKRNETKRNETKRNETK